MADQKKGPPTGALNVERRTWDLEHFEKIAKERLEQVCVFVRMCVHVYVCVDMQADVYLRMLPLPSTKPPSLHPPTHHPIYTHTHHPSTHTYPHTQTQQESGEGAAKKPGIVRKREEFQSAEAGAAGPTGSKRAFLKHRETDLGLDSKVGKTQVVTSASAPHQQGGYWCDVCECLLKDSMAYLDHINGKKHQRALGFSMRVERVDVDRVKERLQAIKAKEQEKKNAGPKESAIKSYERKLDEEEAQKKAWKEARKEAKRQRAKRGEEEAEAEEEEDDVDNGIDPDMAAMMGFGGFK
jgi:U4/U6.U5 tri-snRNP component SNU23